MTDEMPTLDDVLFLTSSRGMRTTMKTSHLGDIPVLVFQLRGKRASGETETTPPILIDNPEGLVQFVAKLVRWGAEAFPDIEAIEITAEPDQEKSVPTGLYL